MSNDIEKLEDIKERIENLKDAYNEMLDELYPYSVGDATYSGSKVFEKIELKKEIKNMLNEYGY